jgi:hypothetical protein
MGAWDWLDVEAIAAKKGNDGRCEGGERGSGHSEEAGARAHTRTHTERHTNKKKRDGGRSGLTRHDTIRHNTTQDNTTRHNMAWACGSEGHIHIHPTF